MDFVCAECGTTKAATYVVTRLDPTDPRGFDRDRTEVCRSCDDILQGRPGDESYCFRDEDGDWWAFYDGWEPVIVGGSHMPHNDFAPYQSVHRDLENAHYLKIVDHDEGIY